MRPQHLSADDVSLTEHRHLEIEILSALLLLHRLQLLLAIHNPVPALIEP
jgi:hypothetical protein